ncbi:MAG: sigma-70 family RNA polymerase sigma factor [Geminicoccaceae bacterium]
MELFDLFRKDLTAEVAAAQRYALVLTRCPDKAEDLVQEALTQAIAGVRTWNPALPVTPWLLTIVHHAHLKRQRRQVQENRALAETLRAQASAVVAPQSARVELSRTIEAMMTLPEEHRAVLVLVAIEGLSYREVADILSVPIGTVMSRLSRARQALRAATGRPAASTSRPARRALRLV